MDTPLALTSDDVEVQQPAQGTLSLSSSDVEDASQPNGPVNPYAQPQSPQQQAPPAAPRDAVMQAAPEQGFLARTREAVANSPVGRTLASAAPSVSNALDLTPTETEDARRADKATDGQWLEWHPGEGAKRVVAGAKDIAESGLLNTAPMAPGSPIAPAHIDTRPNIDQAAKGATEVMGGSMEATKPLMAVGIAAAPIRAAVMYGAGILAGKGAAAVAQQMGATPNEQEFFHTAAFFLPDTMVKAAGVQAWTETQGNTERVSGSAFGGKVQGTVARSPEAVGVAAKVGPFKAGWAKQRDSGVQVSDQAPTGLPQAPPDAAQVQSQQNASAITQAASRAAGTKAKADAAVGIQPASPPPPKPGEPGSKQVPLPAGMDQGHLSPSTVENVGKAIQALPEEQKPAGMLETLKNLTKWIGSKGTIIGPDNKITQVSGQTPDAQESSAKSIATKIVNDEVERQGQQADEARKQQEENAKTQQEEEKEAIANTTDGGASTKTEGEAPQVIIPKNLQTVQARQALQQAPPGSTAEQLDKAVRSTAMVTTPVRDALVQEEIARRANQKEEKAETVMNGAPPAPGQDRQSLQAWADKVVAGDHPFVHVPKDSMFKPNGVDELAQTKVSGSGPFAGTYYHAEDIPAAEIRKAARDKKDPQAALDKITADWKNRQEPVELSDNDVEQAPSDELTNEEYEDLRKHVFEPALDKEKGGRVLSREDLDLKYGEYNASPRGQKEPLTRQSFGRHYAEGTGPGRNAPSNEVEKQEPEADEAAIYKEVKSRLLARGLDPSDSEKWGTAVTAEERKVRAEAKTKLEEKETKPAEAETKPTPEQLAEGARQYMEPDDQSYYDRRRAAAKEAEKRFEKPYDHDLYNALHGIDRSEDRWQKMREKGATDEQLHEAVKKEFGTFSGFSGSGGDSIGHEVMTDKFYRPNRSQATKPTLQGKALVNEVRRLMQIPKPDSGQSPTTQNQQPAEKVEEASGSEPALVQFKPRDKVIVKGPQGDLREGVVRFDNGKGKYVLKNERQPVRPSDIVARGTLEEYRAQHFAPGNVIKSSYWNDHDKVLSYEPGSAGKSWQVRVQKSDAEGTPIKGEPPRIHGTEPNAKDLVVKRAAPPAEESKSEQPAADSKFKYGSTQAAIPQASEAAQALKTAREKIAPEDLGGTEYGGNAQGLETAPHVTVRYGIQGDDVEGIRKYLEQQAPFEATLGKTDKFPPSEHSDGMAPIIAPIDAPELHRIEGEIDKHGDFAERSFPEYKPHATLGYVKPESADKYTGMPETDGKTFTVRSIQISDRDGNTQDVELKGTSPAVRENATAKDAVAPDTAPPAVLEAWKKELAELQREEPRHGTKGYSVDARDRWSSRVSGLKSKIADAEAQVKRSGIPLTKPEERVVTDPDENKWKYQGEYFIKALEPAKEAWVGAHPASNRNPEENWDFLKKNATYNDGRELHRPKEFPDDFIRIEVPGDGKFLVKNTPVAIDKLLKSAPSAFAKPSTAVPGTAKRSIPRAPAAFDNDKYIANLEKEEKDLQNAVRRAEAMQRPLFGEQLQSVQQELALAKSGAQNTEDESTETAKEPEAPYAGKTIPFRKPNDAEAEIRGAEDLFESAWEAEKAGDIDRASTLYEQAAEKDPGYAPALVNLGSIRYNASRFSTAEDLFRRATEADPDYALAFFNLGTTLDELHKTDESIEAYKRAVALSPHYADAHYNLAIALMRGGKTPESLQHWQAYVRLDPTGPWSDHAREQIKQILDGKGLSIASRADKFIPPSKTVAALRLLSNEEGTAVVPRALQTAGAYAGKAAATTLKDAVKSAGLAGRTMKEVGREVVAWLYPRALMSEDMKDILGTGIGTPALNDFRAAQLMNGIDSMFNSLSQEHWVSFVDHYEHGQPQPDKQMQDAADLIRSIIEDQELEEDAATNLGRPKGQRVILPRRENYFPHRYKTLPGGGADLGDNDRLLKMANSRRPLEGSKQFLKQQRMTLREAVEKGAVPLGNPVQMLRKRIQEGSKYIAAKYIMHSGKKAGLAIFLKGNQRAPQGYVDVPDKMMQVWRPVETEKGGTLYQKTGRWVWQEDFGRGLSNYLSRDALRDSKLGNSLVKLKNMTTEARLSWSAFHFANITFENFASGLNIGLDKLYNGGVRNLDGSKAIEGLADIGLSMVSPYIAVRDGGRMLAYAKNPDQFLQSKQGNEFAQDYPDFPRLQTLLFHGGARWGIADNFKESFGDNFTQLIREGSLGAATLKFFPWLSHLMMRPLFEHYIPRSKWMFMAKMLSAKLSQYSQALADGEVTDVQLARQVVDTAENRFGELNFDSMYWNNTFRTLNQIVFRSASWKLGSWRGLAKAAHETIESGKGTFNSSGFNDHVYDSLPDGAARKVTRRLPELGLNAGWIVSMALVAAVTSTVLVKMLTHTNLWEWAEEDHRKHGLPYLGALAFEAMHPRTGQLDVHGEPVRISFPTGLKDYEHFYLNATGYVRGSLSDVMANFLDTMENKDAFGNYVYNPNDPGYQKFLQSLEYNAKGDFLPMSVSNYRDGFGPQSTTSKLARATGLIGGSPKSLDRSKALDLALELRPAHTPETPEQEAAYELTREHPTSHDVRRAIKEKKRDYLEHVFMQLKYADAKKVFDEGTPEERHELAPLLRKKQENMIRETRRR